MPNKSKRELKKEQKIKEENIRMLDEEIKQNKKIPKEYKKKINKQILLNISTLIAIIIYLVCINVLSLYLDTKKYIIVLRVLSVIVAIISVMYFELGYRKDNEKIFLYGVEVLIIAIITLLSTYMYFIFFDKFNNILIIILGIIVIYYAIKISIIRKRMKKQYYKKQNDIKEIIKKV